MTACQKNVHWQQMPMAAGNLPDSRQDQGWGYDKISYVIGDRGAMSAK